MGSFVQDFLTSSSPDFGGQGCSASTPFTEGSAYRWELHLGILPSVHR
jgi:hypothetical protein